jgi:hypothetical protein
VHIHLRQVASFQTRITELVTPINALDSDLRSKTAFPHLSRLHQLPFAYAATVVEVVRRKEFATFLVEWSARLAETLGKFTSAERDRRQEIRNDTLSQLPWSVPAIEETQSPSVDVVLNVGAETLSGINLGRGDVESKWIRDGADVDLLRWVESLKVDKELLLAIEDGESNPIPFLQSNIEGLIGKLDTAGEELDRMIEREGEYICDWADSSPARLSS